MSNISTLANVSEAHVTELFDSLIKAERVTKAALSELSRTLLAHAIQNQTAVLVNRLISGAVLTAPNTKLARMYFENFMPFAQDDSHNFTKFSSKKFNGKKECSMLSVEAWLDNPDNDLWSWVKDNVNLEKKTQYDVKITNLVKKALTDDNAENKLSVEQIVAAVLAGGINAAELADIILAAPVQEAA